MAVPPSVAFIEPCIGPPVLATSPAAEPSSRALSGEAREPRCRRITSPIDTCWACGNDDHVAHLH